ncbi:MAG TPA: winged helix-turn-helix domain-containing protein [Gaiellaceae bacterium]|nr:winged helix-turn-helix domain-containing protein [Gaiellaceae bacterium]
MGLPEPTPSMKPARSLGARQVRALAHPLRMRMLDSLRDGPATASMLARDLGESSGATSYHLRALEAAELVVEDLDRRKGRERWWTRNPARSGLISSVPADDAEYGAALAQLESVILARDEDAIDRYLPNRERFSAEWQETSFIGGWMAYATQEEVEELSGLVVGWLNARRRPGEERPDDAVLMYVTYRALPQQPPGPSTT